MKTILFLIDMTTLAAGAIALVALWLRGKPKQQR
jgi:hypothetical protein